MMWRFSYGMPTKAGRISLFDLGFLEDDVLARNRIVFALFHLVGQRPRIFAGNIVIAGIRAAHEADLDRIRLCHESGSSSLVLNLAAHHSLREKSVKYCPLFLNVRQYWSPDWRWPPHRYPDWPEPAARSPDHALALRSTAGRRRGGLLKNATGLPAAQIRAMR